ncbi:Hypothetical protein CINCED_3A004754 [Cinara cedri]|uniref:Lipase domain-containing protein n=1 Tax=Cinara cedri TaxID=506608 RepID=A0A5E4MBT5_9HEMI|nr:Hypothetical protein CINCED_3A004754 [Cinara cedri]
MTDSNVVLVDWSDWAMQMDYGNLVIQFPTVVPHLADWLNGLHDREIIKTFSDIILIGHSLGAHLVGNAGHRLNGTVSRIIALDPAQPNFRIDHKNERVDVNSGRFVMVLHTSTLLFGLREPVGHVDFYFNGAQFQPTCAVDTTCGHLMSIIYMMDSLKNSTAFPASRCCTVDDCEKKIVDLEKPTVYMNMNTPISTRGLYSILPGRKNLTFYMRLLGYTLKMI